jgi:hypothetical protein
MEFHQYGVAVFEARLGNGVGSGLSGLLEGGKGSGNASVRPQRFSLIIFISCSTWNNRKLNHLFSAKYA